jgi:hypothetical protein
MDDPFATMILGRSPGVVEVATSREGRLAATALAGQARRSIEIVTRALDPALYDDADFVEAVKRLATTSRQARIRVLVQDPLPAVRRGHRLLGLAARLPSFLSLRVPARQHRDYNRAFLVADATGCLDRELADRFEGAVRFADPGRCRALLRDFEDMWEVSEAHPDLRQMRL